MRKLLLTKVTAKQAADIDLIATILNCEAEDVILAITLDGIRTIIAAEGGRERHLSRARDCLYRYVISKESPRAEVEKWLGLRRKEGAEKN